MKILICAVVLVMIHGNVFAGISLGGKIKATSEDAKIFPKPGQPAASNMSHSGRIIKGDSGSVEVFPFIVHLRVKDKNSMSTCGASIISNFHALTAAHCVYMEDPASITLYGGSTSRSKGGIVFYATKVIVHPNYNPDNADYDVAIVQVRNTFQGYKNVAPIGLQNAEIFPGTWCYAVGWGLSNYDKETEPDNVQYAILLGLSPAACSDAYPDLSTIVCAQRRKGVDICQGDSGGPLICNGRLTGASSFVVEGCRGEAPSGFAKVIHPSIRQFIKKHAGV